jgi:uncharacterized protein (TIGR02996 family)
MNGHERFLREIADRPDDPAPRIAYADWLQRRGDERAEYLQLHLLLAECRDDEEFLVLLRRESAIRGRIQHEWFEALGCGEIHARLLRLHEGLWLTDSDEILRWGTPLEKLAACEGASLEQIRPLGVRVVWNERVIWRGMRVTIHADFVPRGDGELPAGVEHFTMMKPHHWFAEESGAVGRLLHQMMLRLSPARRLIARQAYGERWMEQMRLRFGPPKDGDVYRGWFNSLRWEWSCARIELLTGQQGEFLCQWLEHPSARRQPEMRRVDEAANLAPG